MYARYNQLDNLIVFVDQNGFQNEELISKTLDLGSTQKKLEAHGWEYHTMSGHHIPSLIEKLSSFHRFQSVPVMLLCDTIKGKGVSFMENRAEWHSGVMSAEEYVQAMEELS
jgi:transketolase